MTIVSEKFGSFNYEVYFLILNEICNFIKIIYSKSSSQTKQKSDQCLLPSFVKISREEKHLRSTIRTFSSNRMRHQVSKTAVGTQSQESLHDMYL